MLLLPCLVSVLQCPSSCFGLRGAIGILIVYILDVNIVVVTKRGRSGYTFPPNMQGWQ